MEQRTSFLFDLFSPHDNLLVRSVSGVRISLRYKLLLAFLMLVSMMIAMAFLGLQTLGAANQRSALLIRDQQIIAIFNRIHHGISDAVTFSHDAAMENPGDQKPPAAKLVNEIHDLILFSGQSLRELGYETTPEGAKLMGVHRQMQALAPVVMAIQTNRRTGDLDAVHRIAMEKFTPAAQRIQRETFTVATTIQRAMERRALVTREDYIRSRQLMAVACLVAAVLSLTAGYAISSSVLWPVEQIGRTLGQVSAGQFGARADVPNQDEFGALARDVNRMSLRLGGLYSRVEAQKAKLAGLNSELEHKVRRQVEELERTNRLRRFLPGPVVNMITQSGNGEDLLRSQRRHVTVLFADLRGFTAYSNSGPPDHVIGALNAFHSALGPLITLSGGTLERFLGDGLLVLFNAPVRCGDPAARALGLARDMQAGFPGAVRPWQTGSFRLGLGIGIASGQATLGQIGFEERLDYAAIGPAPNLAARLCERAQDGQILLCERTARAVGAPLGPAGPFRLKGISGMVPAFVAENAQRACKPDSVPPGP